MFKKIIRFLIDNYFLSIFFACIAFVALVSFYKLFISKPTYVYVKVKVGQGLWWASTQKPSIWFVKNFQKGDQELDLTGRPIAEILSVRYYPWWGSNQYDVYLLMKLKVSKMGSGKYNFKRSAIGVGAPVDFEFPKVQFSATITELSEKPIKESYQEKIIYISKPFAYPWEYDSIKIGDKYFDGQENVAEVLEKQTTDEANVLVPYKSIIPQSFFQTRQQIIIKLKLKGQIKDNQFVFAEEQIIAPGKTINLATQNFQFQDYLVAKVE
jgi:hypothetical protein